MHDPHVVLLGHEGDELAMGVRQTGGGKRLSGFGMHPKTSPVDVHFPSNKSTREMKTGFSQHGSGVSRGGDAFVWLRRNGWLQRTWLCHVTIGPSNSATT